MHVSAHPSSSRLGFRLGRAGIGMVRLWLGLGCTILEVIVMVVIVKMSLEKVEHKESYKPENS